MNSNCIILLGAAGKYTNLCVYNLPKYEIIMEPVIYNKASA